MKGKSSQPTSKVGTAPGGSEIAIEKATGATDEQKDGCISGKLPTNNFSDRPPMAIL